MAEVTVEKGSVLSLSQLLQLNGVLFWDQVDYPEIPEDAADNHITLNSTNALRIDTIAYESYGDPALLWAIMLANDKLYLNQFRAGETIRIPAKSTIDKILQQSQT